MVSGRYPRLIKNNPKETIHSHELFYSTVLAAGNNRKARDVAGTLLGGMNPSMATTRQALMLVREKCKTHHRTHWNLIYFGGRQHHFHNTNFCGSFIDLWRFRSLSQEQQSLKRKKLLFTFIVA
jgi:hypothetical protein